MPPPPPAPLETYPGVKAELIPPLPTPHWGPQSPPSFTVRATTTIDAPPPSILSALLSTRTWPSWNNFVPRATLSCPGPDADDPSRLHVGALFTEHVDLRGRGRAGTIVKMRLLMSVMEEMDDDDDDGGGGGGGGGPGEMKTKKKKRKGVRVVWVGKGYPDWALRSERVHEVYYYDEEEEGGEGGGGGTVYEVYETFSGPLAWAVRVFVGGTLVRRFGQWNGELRDFVEREKVRRAAMES